MADTKATWRVTLDCECPHCKEDVDLVDADGFWIGVKFHAGEHGTDDSRNVDVYCPSCGEDFIVDFEY